jgi:hypothetical protein
MALTEAQKRNVDILRSQGDTDEQIASNLHLDVKDIPHDEEEPEKPADPAKPKTVK